jgi:HKD family nuclease
MIVTLVVVLPAIAASQHAIGSIHDYERISSRSSRMEEILQRLEKSFEKAATFDELRTEIQNAEDILSTENHEWCVSLSFRRISIPV